MYYVLLRAAPPAQLSVRGRRARSLTDLTNDSKATVSVLYWYGNYPTITESLTLTFWELARRLRLASFSQKTLPENADVSTSDSSSENPGSNPGERIFESLASRVRAALGLDVGAWPCLVSTMYVFGSGGAAFRPLPPLLLPPPSLHRSCPQHLRTRLLGAQQACCFLPRASALGAVGAQIESQIATLGAVTTQIAFFSETPGGA